MKGELDRAVYMLELMWISGCILVDKWMYTCGGHIIRKANPGLVTVEDSLIKGDDGGISK